MSGIADPFNGHIDSFRISRVQHSDGWIETAWNDKSDPPWQALKSRKAVARCRWPAPMQLQI